MKFPFIHNDKFPYSREELADQVGLLGDLIGKRERSLQGAILKQSDVQQQKYLEEVGRYDAMIESAQRTLDFMLSKNLQRIKGTKRG